VIARRRPVDDRLDRDGAAVVLVGDRAVRLSAVATVVVDACPEWTDADDLASLLVSRFGPPPGADAARATRAVLAELARVGLVDLG
jgi:hypothetical protein